MNSFRPQSFEGTVLGLVFSKTGEEIKNAIWVKVSHLTDEISKYTGSIKEVDEFLSAKEKEIKSLDEFYRNRLDEKEANSRPYKRQIDEICKSWNDDEFKFNRETESLIGEKAHVFERGFDDFSDKFEGIDNVDDEVESKKYSLEGMSLMRCESVGLGNSSPEMAMSLSDASPANVSLPTKQDKASARLNTLRSKVSTYRYKIERIKKHINRLEAEKDKLELIAEHLQCSKEYDLDLDTLFSLGFNVKGK